MRFILHATTSAAVGLLSLFVYYAISYKRALKVSRNSFLMKLLGLQTCMTLNRIVFSLYFASSMDDLAREKYEPCSRFPHNQICFIGSSTFTYWQHLNRDMAPLPCLNAAFGGSRTGDVLSHLTPLVLVPQPKVVVYYCGVNDISTGSTGIQAFEGFQQFALEMCEKLPLVRIVYLSMMVTPYQIQGNHQKEIVAGNAKTKEFCETSTFRERLLYVEVNGKFAESSWFLNDGLHLTDEGHTRLAQYLRCPVESMYYTL